jgi:two-component system, OmpR family, phosphate regulon sensor histidine kinase PhoR
MEQWKNAVTITLMTSSILLLLVLQFFWLRGAYLHAGENFRKETNSLFRSTILTMHDSLIQRNLEPVERDSLEKFAKTKRARLQRHLADGEKDTTINYINVTERNARIEIFSTSGNKDSLGRILRPIMTKIKGYEEPKSFILRLGIDSLKTDSIAFHFRRVLDSAGIKASFNVIALRNGPGEKIQRKISRQDGFISETVHLNPITRYAVSFNGIEGLLLKEITPQILFSLFLTLLTLGAFYVLHRNLRAQQRLMKMKNDFISNITHELKTPVATVSVALEALKDFHALDNPQRTAAYLEIAQNELNRLTLMTDKILKTSVFEEHGLVLKKEKFDLGSQIEQVLSSMKLVFEKRKMKLSYEKEGTDFTLTGSAEHLTNVLFNLLDNALKYSEDQSSIKITLKDTADKIILAVADNGIGIAPEYQKRIFDKFFRVPTEDIHTVKGYGLGLSYVAQVIKNHGGEITVDSGRGRGSCFTIVIPKET